MTVAEQVRVFLAMALCGACVGAAHDLLGVLRRGMLLTAAADMMLGLIGAVCVIGAALLLRCEPFRLHTLLGVIVGWAIYASSLGTIVRILIKTLIRLSKKATN